MGVIGRTHRFAPTVYAVYSFAFCAPCSSVLFYFGRTHRFAPTVLWYGLLCSFVRTISAPCSSVLFYFGRTRRFAPTPRIISAPCSSVLLIFWSDTPVRPCGKSYSFVPRLFLSFITDAVFKFTHKNDNHLSIVEISKNKKTVFVEQKRTYADKTPRL